MIPWEEAARRLWAAVPGPLAAERVPVVAAAGRVLAQAVVAQRGLPAGRRAAVDGFAARAAEADGVGRRLRVAGDLWPSALPPPLPPGACLRVAEGALLPEGADCVLSLHQARLVSGDGELVVEAPPMPGEGVWQPGQEIPEGEEALAAGTRLDAGALALLLSLGEDPVAVVRRPRVAVLPVGDELVRPALSGLPPPVVDGNGPALAACLARDGAEAVRWPAVGDEPEGLRRALEQALAGADLVMTTGGVALGPQEVLERVLASLGGEILFHWVAVQPGAASLAARVGSCLVLGLPGAPAAALAAYEALAWPVVRRLAGEPPAAPLQGRLARTVELRPSRLPRLVRAEVRASEDGLWVWPVREYLLGSLAAWAQGSALYVHPAGAGRLEHGTAVQIWRWAA